MSNLRNLYLAETDGSPHPTAPEPNRNPNGTNGGLIPEDVFVENVCIRTIGFGIVVFIGVIFGVTFGTTRMFVSNADP